MAIRPSQNGRTLQKLLDRDHNLLGGVVFGIEGRVIELQARAIEVLDEPVSWSHATKISGMAKGAVKEVMDRIAGAFRKYQVADPQVAILVNLAPADLPKLGTWLDLPIAIILLQAAGMLPDLPPTIEADLILMGELSLHGEVRRVPGALPMAFAAKAGQTLVVPTANERECALITANPAHKGCKVASVSTLDEVMDFFRGKRQLDNVLGKGVELEPLLAKCPDFATIRGQDRAKRAALISAAGGHNLFELCPSGGDGGVSLPRIVVLCAVSVSRAQLGSAYGSMLSQNAPN